MPIEFKKNTAVFINVVEVQEAEDLLQWLQKKSNTKLDLLNCTHLHPANLQVIMAAKAKVIHWPLDAIFADWLKSAIKY